MEYWLLLLVMKKSRKEYGNPYSFFLFVKHSNNHQKTRTVCNLKLHKANIDRIVAINGLRPVEGPVPIDKGLPTDDSIFSHSIFGQTTHERQNIPAYIDLKGHYLHPLTYHNLKALDRNFESCISGTQNFSIKDGKLVPDPNGDTGLEFLYKNWDKLEFRERKSVFANERIKNIKDKSKSWVTKWIMLPAFYRDVNYNEEGRPSYDEINDIYLFIIRMVNSVTQQEQYGLISNISRARIQMALVQIHDRIMESQVKAKKGTFKKYVMGKNTDYGARLVISAPIISGETYDQVQVRFGRIGVPLSSVCAIFMPFVIYGVREFLQNEFQLSGKYPYRNEKGEIEYLTLKNPEYYTSEEYVIKMIKRFIYGTSTRFQPIELPENEEGRKGYLYLTGKFGKEQTTVSQRPMTWTDLLYIVCTDTLSDKHVYFTRYPIEDSFGINPSKFTILTTKKTIPALIGDKHYQFYPIVKVGKDSSTEFIDTLHVHNSYLPGLGGDYDGDMLTLTGTYTDEANADAEKFMQDKKYILTLVGENNRIVQRDFVQTLYQFTKQPKSGDGIPEFKNLSRVAKF